jgi:glycosidase
MIDRFENGDPANDRGLLTGDRTVTGYDPADIGFFHGGDLKGLTSRVGYIASLGFTAIWITPVARQVTVSPTAESAAYHGYWGAGFDEVDPHFGTMQEMKDFVEVAHQSGLKVFLDVVVNHTGDLISYQDGQSYISLDQSPYRRSDGKKFNSVKLANSSSFPTVAQLDTSISFPKKIAVNGEIRKSPDWLNDPRNYHNRGNSGGSGESSLYGDFYGLDDLFTESPEVLQGWIDVFTEWINDVGIDGFRIDTFRHVNREFWLQFLPQMREVARINGKEYFPMWGEIYDSDPGRISEWVKNAGLTEVLDFPIQNSVTGYILDEEAGQLATAFDNDDLYTTSSSTAAMNGTFLGNHDMGRIGGFIFNRFPDPALALAKNEIAHALLYAFRGIPIVYYGDEFGLIGGRDKAARQTLFATQVSEWQKQPRVGANAIGSSSYFETKHPMQDVIRSLSDLRDRYPGLESGPQKFRYAKNATLVFSRYDKKSDTELLFLFNSGRSASKVPLSAISSVEDGGELAIERGPAEILKSHITLPAISWSLLTRKPRDVAGEPKIKLLTPTRYKYDPTLLFLRASVTGSDFGEVEFQYLKGKGEWQSLGKDNSPTFDPTGKRVGDIYRVAPSVAALGQGNSMRFRAILRDNSDSKVLSRQVLLRLGK